MKHPRKDATTQQTRSKKNEKESQLELMCIWGDAMDGWKYLFTQNFAGNKCFKMYSHFKCKEKVMEFCCASFCVMVVVCTRQTITDKVEALKNCQKDAC